MSRTIPKLHKTTQGTSVVTIPKPIIEHVKWRLGDEILPIVDFTHKEMSHITLVNTRLDKSYGIQHNPMLRQIATNDWKMQKWLSGLSQTPPEVREMIVAEKVKMDHKKLLEFENDDDSPIKVDIDKEGNPRWYLNIKVDREMMINNLLVRKDQLKQEFKSINKQIRQLRGGKKGRVT